MRKVCILLSITTPLALATILHGPRQSFAARTETKPSTQALTEAPSAVAYPATTRSVAAVAAKKTAGRADPMAPISGFTPFPPPRVEVKSPKLGEGTNGAAPKTQSDSHTPSSQTTRLVPPPPPMPAEDELPVSALPLPPDRPSISSKLKLTGIIGDKGVFAINDYEARRINKWPMYLIMTPGDRFESIELISVGSDSAVLREDGERSVKALERIR
jgi:hypothetical protein